MDKIKLLIVEDDAIIAKIIEKYAKDCGYSISDIVDSGEEAIKNIEKNKPDLVLMDIELKGRVDGIEAAEKIKSNADIPVIYLTSHSEEETLSRAKITEPFGYIIKPFEKRELHSNIEMTLFKHREEKKLREKEERYRLLYKRIPIPYQSLDENGDFMEVNDAFLDKLGYFREEVLGTQFWNLIAPEYKEQFRKGVPRFKEKGEVSGIEFKLKRKDGFYITVEYSARIVYDLYGNFKQTHCVWEDTSARKQVEEEKEELIKKLQDSLIKIKELEKLIPICASCKKLRDDRGFWKHVDEYLVENTSFIPNHAICPGCAKSLYPGSYDKDQKPKSS